MPERPLAPSSDCLWGIHARRASSGLTKAGSGDQRAPEQHVVLEMNVDHELLFERLQSDVERTPCGARLGGRLQVAGELPDDLEVAGMCHVLPLQYLHRTAGHPPLAAED